VTGVVIEERRGTADELHTADPFTDGPPAQPTLWVCDVTAPAIVLGSRQKPDLLDLDVCRRSGYDVVTRRSGGGAVLLEPGAVCWIDVVVPHGVAPDDVRGSMLWVGHIWRDALASLGADPDALTVHVGDMTRTPWSDLVCFAGVGPGEVIADGHKLVGLSQRRTRHGIRIQCQAHRTPLLGRMPRLFSVPIPDVELVESAVLADVVDAQPDDSAVVVALASAMERRITAV
jgi:hypothetical protein